MGKNNMLDWLETTPIPLSEISRQTGISRNTLYAWVSKKSEIRDSNYLKIVDKYGDFFITKGENMALDSGDRTQEGQIESHYVIGLQKDKIAYQQAEIDNLKKKVKQKQAESTHWEALEFDFICNVTLFRSGLIIGRVIDSVTEIDYQAKLLGYTKQEMAKFWDIGVKHTRLDKHPIEQIIDEETSKNIHKQATTMPLLFDSLKSIVGDHYLPQPVIYIHKEGHKVPAMAYNKVSWRSLKVTAKVKFLGD